MTTITPGMLMSMAIRSDHALGFDGYYDTSFFAQQSGVSHHRRLEVALTDALRAAEEVAGHGFYSPDKDESYEKMIPADLLTRLRARCDELNK